jgi:hypothetical protein
MTAITEGTLAANGVEELNVRSATVGGGNFATLWAKGTWGSGTLKVMGSPTELYADGYVSFQVRAASYWLVLSGATTPSIEWWAI